MPAAMASVVAYCTFGLFRLEAAVLRRRPISILHESLAAGAYLLLALFMVFWRCCTRARFTPYRVCFAVCRCRRISGPRSGAF